MKTLLLFFGLTQLVICDVWVNKAAVTPDIQIEPVDNDYLELYVKLFDAEIVTVCREDGADFCDCDKSGKVDCRKETRDRHSRDRFVKPFKSAAITINSTDFKAKYVYLSGNQIDFLDQKTLLPNIQGDVEGLDLSFNDIEHIEEGAFDKFEKLRKLRLNQNFLKLDETTDGWITEKLGKSLELLNLAYNSITNLNDGAFSPLHNLKKLFLDGNTGIILTDNTFQEGTLTKLEALSLDNCNLKDLPLNIFKNVRWNLKSLSLIGNKFTGIPAALKVAYNLQTLDLSRNKEITQWPANAFGSNIEISSLYLRGMNIQEYVECAFCGLKNLKSIDLSESKKLSSIDINAFGYTNETTYPNYPQGLRDVKLENCNLTELIDDTLGWGTLRSLWLGGNPWNCERLDWLENRRLPELKGMIEPRCAEPKSMKGVSLLEIRKKKMDEKEKENKKYREEDDSTEPKKVIHIWAKPSNTHYFTIRNHCLWHVLFYGGAAVVIISLILALVLISSNKRNVMRNKLMANRGFSNLNFEPMDDKVQVMMDDVEDEDKVYRPY